MDEVEEKYLEELEGESQVDERHTEIKDEAAKNPDEGEDEAGEELSIDEDIWEE